MNRVFKVVSTKYPGVQKAFSECAVLVAIDQQDPSAAVEAVSS